MENNKENNKNKEEDKSTEEKEKEVDEQKNKNNSNVECGIGCFITKHKDAITIGGVFIAIAISLYTLFKRREPDVIIIEN
jgi:ribosomal protein S27AE